MKLVKSNRMDNVVLNRIALIYGLIVAVVNYVGYLLANSGGMPIANTSDYQGWLEFMGAHSRVITVLSAISFIIPALLIVLYRVTSKNKWKKRIINLPFVFSIFGSLGWVLSFAMEIGCLIIAKNTMHIHIAEIIVVSMSNILEECICIFTMAFLILDFIHRKYVLPKLYPDGNLSSISKRHKPSIRFLVHIFYLSICIFPTFFLISTLVNIIRNNNASVNKYFWITIVCILLFSVIILWTFCDYIITPIKRLKAGTKKISDGEFGYHVSIVRNDDFGELADVFNDMSTSLDEKNKKILAVQDSIIKGMAVMVESRDNSTGGHINRTSECVRIFVEKLSQIEQYKTYTPEYWKAVIKAAPMHDLGKIAVDDAILRKPGKFTDEEFEKMKMHSSEGARIVENVLYQVDDKIFKQVAVNVAHYHHEKWNGLGYPEKISGVDIPFEARVMALADVFDALVSKRCYKESFSYDKAFEIIEESLGTHFDPELGKIFIGCRTELEQLYDNITGCMSEY